MAKELPYFQFEPAEYLTRDISFCSLSAQGLFTNICSYYWQRECNLTKEQILRRLNYEKEFNELVDEGVIDLEGENIKIKFLDAQYSKATELSSINSINGSKGGAKKGNQNAKKTTEKQPKNNRKTTEKQGIREDKMKEDNINTLSIKKESEVSEIKVEPDDVKLKQLFYQTEDEFLDDWNTARTHFEGKQSNISKLTTDELTDFKKLNKVFTIEQFKNGIRGLFKQKEMYAANRLRPRHFLSEGNIEKYIDCHLNKSQLFQSKVGKL